MRVIVIGFNGTIGSAVVEALESAHEIVRVAHDEGDFLLDLADPDRIRALYREVGPVDAVACAAGLARFGPLLDLTDEDYESSLQNKLMGQVNLVRLGIETGGVREGGSFTLISGNLSIEPEPNGALAGLVSGALEAWTRGASLELEGRYRVNVVSPRAIREALMRWGMDPEPGIPASEVAGVFRDFVEGGTTGEVAFL